MAAKNGGGTGARNRAGTAGGAATASRPRAAGAIFTKADLRDMERCHETTGRLLGKMKGDAAGSGPG